MPGKIYAVFVNLNCGMWDHFLREGFKSIQGLVRITRIRSLRGLSLPTTLYNKLSFSDIINLDINFDLNWDGIGFNHFLIWILGILSNRLGKID